MELESRVINKVTEFLRSEFIEKKVEASLEQAVDKALADLTGGWGEVTKIVKKEIEQAMVPVIERHDYGQYVLKLDAVLTEVLKQAALPSNEILTKFKTIAAPVAGVASIDDLFQQYCKHVSKNVSTSNLKIDYDDTPAYEAVKVSVDMVEDEDRYSFSNSEYINLEFRCDEDKEMNIDIKLYKSYNGTWKILNGIKSAEIGSISRLSEFEAFLLSLDMNFVEIDISDGEDGYEEWVDVEELPYE